MADRRHWSWYKPRAINLLAIILLLLAAAAIGAYAVGYAERTWLWVAPVVVPIAVMVLTSDARPPPPNACRRLPKPAQPSLSKPDVEAWRAAILATYKDNHEYIRHHEAQRSTVSTLTVTGAAAAIAASLYDRTLTPTDVAPLSIAAALALFGWLFCEKQYERTRMHVERVDALMDEYAATLGGKNVIDIIDFADSHHNSNWTRWRFLPVNRLWLGFHLFLSTVCLVILVQIIRPPAGGTGTTVLGPALQRE